MTAKPVVPRAKAREDIDHAIEHYINEAGTDVAIGFIDALEQAHAPWERRRRRALHDGLMSSTCQA